jgi:nitrite reductase/ring-hydroxylating ferredoxin subunit
VNLFVRGRTLHIHQTNVAALPFTLSIIAVALLSVSGYLGGKMVYDDGIGVGRHRRQRGRTPSETIKAPDDQGWIELGGMQDGDSLRADIGGTVVAIAKADGQVYAFQEFCTHRYGPLSEGSFEGQNVRCPWHGSCFDMRTGRVVEGPAKTDIRAFEVEIVEGRARIRVTGEA